MPIPELPVLPEEDSMLSRKFGREVANYFAGSPLNRVSFLRGDHEFLRSAFAHPSAAFLLMNNLGPLVRPDDVNRLAYASTADVVPLTGPDPFGKTEQEHIRDFRSDEANPVILFLGVDEKYALAPAPSAGAQPFRYKSYQGSPYFAVDVTPREHMAEKANSVIEALKAKGLVFHEVSGRHMGLPSGEAAMYGQARAWLDWNARNRFCATCGQPNLSVQAGTKLVCPPTDSAGGEVRERKPCSTRGRVSNLSFPRTDPTIIVAVVSADGKRVLLGRQRRWPADFYSTLAGFLEPGESIEEAVRREVWEESGVRVGRVVIHSSQPWPFPASLMIGALAQALPGDGETIFLGNDPELEDAKWFPIEYLGDALANANRHLDEPVPQGHKTGDVRLPPRTAIANRLISAAVDGWGVLPRI